MTIASATRGEIDYTGTGSRVVYPYTFMVYALAHLVVKVVSPAGVQATLDYSSDGVSDDYTVDGVGNGTGGNVTLLDNGQAWMTGGFLTSGWRIFIFRTVPLTQLANLRGEGGYSPATNEQALDLLTMANQQLQAQLVTMLQVPDTEAPPPTLPAASARANGYLGFDASGNPTITTAAGFVNAATLINTIDSVAALKALAVPASAVTYYVRGYYAAGDGGHGFFMWNSADVTAEDRGTVFAPNAGGVGRWNRIYQTGILNFKWFGAKADGSTSDSTACSATLAAAAASKGAAIDAPAGVYILPAKLTIPYKCPIVIRGVGVPDQATGAIQGTELRSTLRDGTSPAIDCVQAGSDFSLFSMEDLYLSGGTYLELTAGGGPGQGGTPIGNFVGLSMKNRARWSLRNVRIAGFDTDAMRLDVGSYYGAAYTCAFMFSGCGVNSIDGGNVEGFYNCHFQYNVYGTKNLRNTFGCSWEGQWKSGAVGNLLGTHLRMHTPYFEANNGSITAGEGDILGNVTNYPGNISVYDGYFASPATYSGYAAATHAFVGKCSGLHFYGTTQFVVATPQLYPVLKLVGATTVYWHLSTSINFANLYELAAGSQFINLGNDYLDVSLGGVTTLTHYSNKVIRVSAAGPQNLDNIDNGTYFGQRITLMFADANVSVRSTGGGTGNIRLSATPFVSSTNDTMTLVYDPNGTLWKEVSRSVNL